MNWWEIDTAGQPDAMPRLRAVAYYRHSAQDRHYVAHPVMWCPVRVSSISGVGAVVDAT
jgi:hypothetical protein